jgi:hypothetical protein
MSRNAGGTQNAPCTKAYRTLEHKETLGAPPSYFY